MKRVALVVFAVAIAIVPACTDDGDDDVTGQAGSFAGTGALPFAPAAGVSGGGAGGAGRGGAGMSSMAGSGTSGGAVPTAGSGGVGSGGTASTGVPPAGQSGGGGMGGSAVDLPMVDAGGAPSAAATPSAGCDHGAGRPQGGVVVAGDHYFKFPESYDGTRPFPVLVGFHGCGAGNRGTSEDDTEWMKLTDGSDFARDYVRVAPRSTDSGGCWSYDTDIARVKQMYDGLLESHCVDTSRVFATGHSSGAQLIVQILMTSHTVDAQHLSFKAVAPVAASDYGPVAGPVPLMYIQGMKDTQRGNGDGHETVARFRAANGCGSTSMPYSQVAGCQSGSTSVEAGCVVYDGCDAPTIWCSHNDPAYSGTMHGVPCFGVRAMHDFFESLL